MQDLLLSIDSGTIDWSRAQFALTAIYHWLFVPLTLGLAVIMGICVDDTIHFYMNGEEIDYEEVVDLLNKQDMMIESQTKQLQKQHKIIKEQDKRIIELEKENGELHLLIKEYEFAKKEGYGDAK